VHYRFNQILCQRSFAHLRAVFDEYGNISKKTIEDAIKSEFSGDIKDGLLTVGERQICGFRLNVGVLYDVISFILFVSHLRFKNNATMQFFGQYWN